MPRLPSSTTLHLLGVIVVGFAWVFPALVLSAETPDAVSGNKGFSCRGRPSGYYADVQSGCQRYHMCDAGGRRYNYACPNQTLFQQRVMICDHWFMVDCALSESFFAANSLLGQPGRLFLETSQQQASPSTQGTGRRGLYGRRPVDRSSAAYLAGVARPTPAAPAATLAAAPAAPAARTLPSAYAGNPFFRIATGTTPTPTPTPRTPSTTRVASQQASVTRRPLTGQGQVVSTPKPAQLIGAASPESAPAPFGGKTAPATFAPFYGDLEATPAPFYGDLEATPAPFYGDLEATPAPFDDAGSAPAPLEDGADSAENTVELRFADTRRMFFIPDNALREAEMLRAAHDTVLRIALAAPTAAHGAMRFKEARGRQARQDVCPQCHPAFLLPGSCHPCVVIR